MIIRTVKHLKQRAFLKKLYIKATNKKTRKNINGYKRDVFNIIRYGWSAPRFCERIWIHPDHCTRVLFPDTLKEICKASKLRETSGLVIESSWPYEQTFQIYDFLNENYSSKDWDKDLPVGYGTKFKFKVCMDHWVKGIPWAETGIYEFLEKQIKLKKEKLDGCNNIDDIVSRYNKLDYIFEQIKKDGKMKTRKDVANKFRESGGIYVHIGPGGEPFWGSGAQHRFAIAHILGIVFPAQIGCVHISAIPFLKQYREN